MDFCFVMCKNGKCSLFLPNIVMFWELCNCSTLREKLVWQMMHFIIYIIFMSTSKVWSWRNNTQIILIQWNNTQKCWVYAKYAYQTLHKDNYSFVCTSYQLSINSFHTFDTLQVVFCGLAMTLVSFASSPMHVSNLENDIWPISIIKTWKESQH